MKLSAREGVYYAAWMSGIIITVSVGKAINAHHLLSLIAGVGIGWGLGVMAEKCYDAWQRGNIDDDEPFGGSRDDFRK